MKHSPSPYWLLFILLSFIVVVRFLFIDRGFFTFYDEAYFLLKARDVADGIITGKSQWNFLAVNWFPFWDLSDAVYSRAAGNILAIVMAIVATIACIVSYGKKDWIKYLSVCFLVALPVGGHIGYVNMQAFLLCSSLSTFLIYMKVEDIVTKKVMLILTGFLSGLAVFVIMPGGILSLLGYCTVVFLLNRGNTKRAFKQILLGLIGVMFSLVYFHLFICDLKDVVEAMEDTAAYFAKSGYHYDPKSFAIAIGLFLRDSIFILVFYCGAYFLANKVNPSKMNLLSGFIYMALIFVYLYYQKKPVVTSAMFFSSVVVIPFIFKKREDVSLKWLFSEECIISAFLFCFPLMASIGTNTALGSRIACFLVAWCFIWFGTESAQGPGKLKWYIPLAAILTILVPMVKGAISTIQDTENCVHFEKGNRDFAKIYINPTQKEYFDKVYDLMQDYGFQEDSSVVLTAAFDYATVLAFNAKLSSNFHQINNFLYWDKSKMIRPDFIILCGWDEIVIGEELKKAGWGWPEEFDAYDMGTPETTVIRSADIEQRKVYCRK